MFCGSYVAIVTPFSDGKVDYKKLEELIEFQISNGTDGIVPAGCTGEAATLTHEEQKKVIEFTVKTVNGRCKVVAGTGSNCTEEALELTKYAEKVGADGALLISPYYNKPTPEGQYLHYKYIAERTQIPIMLYNVPSRTGKPILPETVARLSEIKNIVAIKEAGGSVETVSKILSLCNITVLSGDDSLTLPMMSVGAKGVVSVVANIVPQDVKQMIEAFNKGDLEKARELHYKMYPLVKELFTENNPMGIKTALKLVGKLNGELRLPLCNLQPNNVEKLKKVLQDYGLI